MPAKSTILDYNGDLSNDVTDWEILQAQLRLVKTTLSDIQSAILSCKTNTQINSPTRRFLLLNMRLADCEYISLRLNRLHHEHSRLLGTNHSTPESTTTQTCHTTSLKTDDPPDCKKCSVLVPPNGFEQELATIWATLKAHVSQLQEQMDESQEATHLNDADVQRLLLRAWRMHLVNVEWFVHVGIERVKRREAQLKDVERIYSVNDCEERCIKEMTPSRHLLAASSHKRHPSTPRTTKAIRSGSETASLPRGRTWANDGHDSTHYLLCDDQLQSQRNGIASDIGGPLFVRDPCAPSAFHTPENRIAKTLQRSDVFVLANWLGRESSARDALHNKSTVTHAPQNLRSVAEDSLNIKSQCFSDSIRNETLQQKFVSEGSRLPGQSGAVDLRRSKSLSQLCISSNALLVPNHRSRHAIRETQTSHSLTWCPAFQICIPVLANQASAKVLHSQIYEPSIKKRQATEVLGRTRSPCTETVGFPMNHVQQLKILLNSAFASCVSTAGGAMLDNSITDMRNAPRPHQTSTRLGSTVHPISTVSHRYVTQNNDNDAESCFPLCCETNYKAASFLNACSKAPESSFDILSAPDSSRSVGPNVGAVQEGHCHSVFRETSPVPFSFASLEKTSQQKKKNFRSVHATHLPDIEKSVRCLHNAHETTTFIELPSQNGFVSTSSQLNVQEKHCSSGVQKHLPYAVAPETPCLPQSLVHQHRAARQDVLATITALNAAEVPDKTHGTRATSSRTRLRANQQGSFHWATAIKVHRWRQWYRELAKEVQEEVAACSMQVLQRWTAEPQKSENVGIERKDAPPAIRVSGIREEVRLPPRYIRRPSRCMTVSITLSPKQRTSRRYFLCQPRSKDTREIPGL